MRRLRAIFAVLGTGAGLDRKQAGKLHLPVGMVAPVYSTGLIDQLQQRPCQKGNGLLRGPIVAGFGL